MADNVTPVVPIRPDVMLKDASSFQLLEFVTEALAKFATDNPDEPCTNIAFFIMGKDGSTKAGWLTGEGTGESAFMALAGAVLMREAAKALED